jgi:hypothetical protein
VGLNQQPISNMPLVMKTNDSESDSDEGMMTNNSNQIETPDDNRNKGELLEFESIKKNK